MISDLRVAIHQSYGTGGMGVPNPHDKGISGMWDFNEHANFFKGVDPARQNRMIMG